MSPTGQQGFDLDGVDLDEDLFEFASVARDAAPEEDIESLDQIFASFRDTAAAPLATEAPPDRVGSVLVPPPVEPVAEARAALTPRTAPPSLNVDLGRPPEAEAVARARRGLFPFPPLSQGVVAIAAAVTLLNSIVAVIVLGDRSGPVETEAIAAPGSLANPASTPARDEHGASLPEPGAVKARHDHPTLDVAREQIGRGEYGAARQSVYGLLAIIDRVENPRRGDLEADCQYLIAQSLHLEALARMGEVR